jgi:putative transposase
MINTQSRHRRIVRGKSVRTTISDKAAPCPLDRVNREFRVPAPNRLWVSDFTYVASWAGFVYVAFVIDAYARRIVGWRVSRSMEAGFVLDALDQAPRPASCPRSAASATATTTPLPRR